MCFVIARWAAGAGIVVALTACSGDSPSVGGAGSAGAGAQIASSGAGGIGTASTGTESAPGGSGGDRTPLDGGAEASASGQGGSAGSGLAETPDAGGSIKVFIDTDLVWDPGDISAMTLAHGLADQCDIEIIGTTAVTTRATAAPALDAINTYFGRPDIPLGVLKGDTFLDGTDFTGPLKKLPVTRYHDNSEAPDATQVFREVLAQQPDKSVAVVSIGPLRNLSRFLKSTPDGASPLSGKDLIQAKVKFLSAMAGVFVQIGAFGGPVTSEWNIEQDPQAAKDVVEGWPSPIMFSGFEIGWYTCPDYLAITGDPMGPMGLVLGDGVDGVPCEAIVNMGKAYGRPGWDQTALLYAARGLGTFWTGEMKGSVTVDPSAKGANKWTASPDRGQGFLTNIGIDPNDGEAVNHAKLKPTLTKTMAEIEALAGKSGQCKAKK
jgi:inosine-uridine nucleoside N-ribohydrolase